MKSDVRQENKPFFSICIEVVNREETITRVLRCINSQICRDFELIVVDNGSIDNSATIIDEELEKIQDVHVRFVREERKSNAIAGWNRPLSFAKGIYIAICEGDDYYEPNHLFQAKKILEQLPIAGLYVSDLKLNEDVPRVIVSSPQRKLSELKSFGWCPPPSCVIFRRASLEGIRFNFDETFVWAGEYSLYYKILMKGFIVIENKEKKNVTRGIRFYNKDSFHLKDMLKMREGGYFIYSEDEAAKADSKIFEIASQYFAFNLGLGKLDFKLLKVMLKYGKIDKVIRTLISRRFVKFIWQGVKRRIISATGIK